MALIKCTECGREVSDKANICPSCGCPIEKKIYCVECGQVLSKMDKICPNCGCPIEIVKNENSTDSNISESKVNKKQYSLVVPAINGMNSVQKETSDKAPINDSLKRKNMPAWGKWGLLASIPAVVFLIVMIGKGFWGTGSSEETFIVNGVSFVMVPVEGGTFQMGSTDSEADSDEKPVHSVTLSSYSIGQTEVTQELWEAVMGSNPSNFYGSKLPVEWVSWEDCQTFIARLNQLTGAKFRLPTEAEWEYAARGGKQSNGYKYSGSNTLSDVAWYHDNSGSNTHEVATKLPNELGLYDMTGNVWEWCQDCYGDYSSSAQTNPTGASSGSDRVYRGGSFFSDAGSSGYSNRGSITPLFRIYDLGLRLAL